MINIISVYDSKETNFTHNGETVLSDCIACIVEEEINGIYEVTIEYPLDERGKWKYLLEGNIVKIDGQLFRCYRKTKSLTSISINLRHIYYDLLDNFLEDCRPTNLSGSGAVDWVLTHTQYAHSFTSTGDVGGSDTQYFIRKNPVEAITTIINTWGGELVRDNFSIELLQARGLDRGVLVSYGKNIQGIEETLDMDSLCTRLMPIGKDGLLLTEKYVDSQYIDNYPHPVIKVVEFTDIETETELRTTGQNYITDSKCDIPKFNYKIDFLELSKTEEYKIYAVLERVYLGDTVTIKHSKLDINLKAKVIKITKNILTDRIEKIELGSFKSNIATAINNSIQEVKKEIAHVTSAYQIAIENATNLITGSNGGNVVIHQNDNGQPDKIFIMDTTDVMTAMSVWCWSIGGFGYSSTGINGPYDTAITMDGSIVGKFITALEVTGQQVKTGILSSLDGSVNINLDNGEFSFGGDTGTTTITKDYIKVTHSDESYTKMDATGLKRHIGIADKNYHYLMHIGQITSFSGNETMTITLPEEFKNKNFKVVAMINSFQATMLDEAVYYALVDIYPQDINYINATFLVLINGLAINMDTRQTKHTKINFSYIAIA